ncbi:MAG: hypothetical protein M1827_005530 [Pycnora praestabilis]|nr:MAG: hypothetical protein M1827_005530 [Pycnora praestabilis]
MPPWSKKEKAKVQSQSTSSMAREDGSPGPSKLTVPPRATSSPDPLRLSPTLFAAAGRARSPTPDGIKILARTDFHRQFVLPNMASFLTPRSANKQKAHLAALDESKAVSETAKKNGTSPPKYEFLELIGKGSFGRVFKCKDLLSHKIVAVKIINVDQSDYQLNPREANETIKDFINEITVLQQLKDSNAKNVNVIYETFPVHSQLWIVSEYCPGGSLHTLMRAGLQPGLDEKYIIPIARELAEALKSVHDAGIIHRDVKAANVLVSEDGRLQLCDFGVSGVLQTKLDKRSTIIGTPYWMPPEMHKATTQQIGYGNEVDGWAYGCTIYEIATGLPPNAKTRPEMLGIVLMKAPRLEGGNYSNALREFSAYCLEERAKDRPSMGTILKHPYVANTSKKYPTNSLKELIERYWRWEQSGGQRNSLFNPGGAVAAELPGAASEDEWNFSTTDNFDGQFGQQDSSSFEDYEQRDPYNLTSNNFTPERPTAISAGKETMTPEQKAEEQRVQRGAGLERIFDENAAPYEYRVEDEQTNQISDLPLRNLDSDRSSIRDTQIDLGDYDPETGYSSIPNLDLGNVPTIRAHKAQRFLDSDDEDEEASRYEQDNRPHRATKDWKFPSAQAPVQESSDRRATQDWKFPTMVPNIAEPSASGDDVTTSAPFAAFRPRLTHTVTAPTGAAFDGHLLGEIVSAPGSPRHSIIDLDFAEIERPSTASSFAGSTSTDITSGNPFDLEDTLNDINNGKRLSTHYHSKSEPAGHDTGYQTPSSFGDDSMPPSTQHSRQASLSSDGSDIDMKTLRARQERHDRAAKKQFDEKMKAEWENHPFLTQEPKSIMPDNFELPAIFARYDPATNPAPPSLGPPPFGPVPRLGDPDFPGQNGLRSIGTYRPRTRVHPMATSSDSDSAAAQARVPAPALDLSRFTIPEPVPPSAAALRGTADQELLIAELEAGLRAWIHGLGVAGALFDAVPAAPAKKKKKAKKSKKGKGKGKEGEGETEEEAEGGEVEAEGKGEAEE